METYAFSVYTSYSFDSFEKYVVFHSSMLTEIQKK
jgi:hypothetical protein